MKKLLILLTFIFTSCQIIAQHTLEGIVVDEFNTPLEGASVYLNNTTIGTSTNKNGQYTLLAETGKYTVIVSFLGFNLCIKEIHLNANTELSITLKSEAENIDEVVIKKTIYDDLWKYNLNKFKQEFIGKTNLSKNCKILNPKTLSFEFDSKTITFTAYAKKPLLIKNKDLGYMITFDLVDFTIEDKTVTYLGYSKYTNLKNASRKKIQSNRNKAYNGSILNFFRDLREKQIKNSGFVINQFKRIKNPERPSDKKIKNARELIKLSGKNVFSIENEMKTDLDSAFYIAKKASLPKFISIIYKKNVLANDLIIEKNNTTYLNFENFLQITYTKEKEEENYLNGFFKRRKSLGVQVSNLCLLKDHPIIEKSGYIDNPLDVFFEGYWGFEKIANSLPLNYAP